MKRYLNILKIFWDTSLSSQMEYQLNFIVELIAMIGTLTGSIFILSLFFSNGQQIGYWTLETALIIQGIYTILDGITNTFLKPNLSQIVNHVREGTLDFILLKPIDSQFWLSTRTISPSGLPEIFLGIILIFWSFPRTGELLNILNLIVFVLLLISAILILYSLWFLVASTSIWFVKTWNATEVLRALLAAGRYPILSYPVTLRFVFSFILPVAFLTTVPAEALLGKVAFTNIILGFIISFSFFLITRIFWKFALKFYTSASS